MQEVDYLIVGAGATGLAFADTLVQESDACVAIVDRNRNPGGHWNFAYDFVRLHQPSEFYGVESVPLGDDGIDTSGWNAGYHQLASGAEVLDYYSRVVNDHLVPTGRVSYFPRTNHIGQGTLKSLATGARLDLKVRCKIVDATYYGTSIPALHVPNFDWSEDVTLIPPNQLSSPWASGLDQYESICIIGAGKTGMDVGVRLIDLGIPGDRISWVMPRDSWLLNRSTLQPGDEFFESTMQAQAKQMLALAQAHSAEDLFHRLEDTGVMLRIFQDVEPSMYHCAIISEAEIALLQQIQRVVRKGHLRRLKKGSMELDEGTVSMPENTLYIDCSASAVTRNPQVSIFEDDRITLQMARTCQPVFSAAMIGMIESLDLSTQDKNGLCRPLPLPDTLDDYFAIALNNMMNQYVWSRTPETRQWMMESRLDGFTRRIAAVTEEQTSAHSILTSFRDNMPSAISNIQKLMHQRA